MQTPTTRRTLVVATHFLRVGGMGVGFPMKDSSPAGISVADFGKDSPSLSS